MRKYKESVLLAALLSSSSFAMEVSKEQWLTRMKTALPTVFCHSSQYFRHCFEVSAMECEETAGSATRICLQDLTREIPAVLQQPQDGTRWGSKIGECAGNAYEIALTHRKIASAKCNDPANWQ